MSQHPKRNTNITRRKLFQFAGATLAASPFVPTLEAQGQTAGTKKALFLGSHNGLVMEEVWPEQTGPNLEFKRILAPLEPLKERVTLVGGTRQDPHPGGAHRGHAMVLTNTSPDGNRNGTSISVDQEIANHISADAPLKSINLGTMTLDRSTMYWRGRGDGLKCEDNPERSFDVVFGNRDPEAGQRIRLHRQSIIDQVNSDLTAFQASISAQDQQVLDQHLTSIRELEQSLSANVSSCGNGDLQVGNDGIRETVDSNHKLMRVALACGVSNVGIHMIGRPVGRESYPWLEFNGQHHETSHKNDNRSIELLTRAHTYYFEEFAKMAQLLAETPGAGGQTLLDETMIVYSNPISRVNAHAKEDMPFVVIGGNWHFKGNMYGRFEDEGVGRFHVNLLHAMGIDRNTFGNRDTGTDPLPGLAI